MTAYQQTFIPDVHRFGNKEELMSRTKDGLKKQLEATITALEEFRDETRVQLHLAGMETRNRWNEVEPHLHRLLLVLAILAAICALLFGAWTILRPRPIPLVMRFRALPAARSEWCARFAPPATSKPSPRCRLMPTTTNA